MKQSNQTTAHDDQLPATDSSNADGSQLSLSESLDGMKSRFSEEMSGARQATQSHLVRFLASALSIAEHKAERVFERLQSIGAVGRNTQAESENKPLGWTFENRSPEDPEILQIEKEELSSESNSSDQELAVAEDLLRRAITARATDIHMDPFDEEVEVRFRIDGQLQHYCRLSDLVAAKTIAQLKLMGELDVAEPFEPQEGRLELPASLGEHAARVTVVPVDGGEAVAVRLLHRDRLIRPLEEMGFSPAQQTIVDRLMQCREGIVLVAGPTGSGKTTTLYSLLHALDDEHQNIVTIEDPIEFRIPSFLQIEVDEKHNVTHAKALKTVLRMDPDIVMMGEIRDADAAAIAMRAADTGSYVFSTVHARDAASMLTAMRDLHIDERSLASNLRAVISQRLVRRLCPNCKQAYPPSDDEKAEFESAAIEVPESIFIAVGCDHCKGSGYLDRIGVYEVVENSAEIASAIQSGVAEAELRKLFRSCNIASLATNGLLKVTEGVTDFEELRRMAWVAPTTVQDSSGEAAHDTAKSALWEI